MIVEECDRCDSKIVDDRPRRGYTLPPLPDTDDDPPFQTYREEDAVLCSTCIYELYEWVKGEDVDRAGTADPESIKRLKHTVTRQIESLEDVLDEIDDTHPDT